MSKSVRRTVWSSITSNILKQAAVCVLCLSIVWWQRLKILSEWKARDHLSYLLVFTIIRTFGSLEKSIKCLLSA